uniref:PIPK domain-containing protein n=1 Tax=Graphocephala atropunctata TaxID=36148 RepID=A0A1B6M3W5_9HEMI
MASGDYFHIEAGNIIDMLKNECDTIGVYMDIGNTGEVYISENQNTNSKIANLRPLLCSEENTLRKIETERKLGHRRVHTDGGVTFKNINTTVIMNSIQLGIQRSVEGSNVPDRDVLMDDFMTVETAVIHANDSTQNTAHKVMLKTYAPIAFQHFRDLFGIRSEHFVKSFCEVSLIELPNPGASGSVFYVTQNDEFITKTIRHKEAEFLQKLLPGYYLNLNQNPQTLLPKFFGLYCYKCVSKNVRTVVMNNVLPSLIKVHQKYDLKGSTCNRKASKTESEKISPTFKDLDYMNHHPEGIFLEEDVHRDLLNAIQRDCRVLESFQIIDYSLLLGIHNVDQAKREEICTEHEGFNPKKEPPSASGDGYLDNVEEIISQDPDNQRKDENVSSLTSHRENLELAKGYIFPGIPARQANGENILLFIGIIDILQSYKLKKKLEHVWKSIVYDSDSVSVHNPRFYSQRFQDFITKTVFKTTPLPPKATKRKALFRLKP